jgi:LysM domain-containing protein
LDRPVSEIQDLNPALLRPVVPGGYQLHVPKGTTATLMAALDNVPEAHRGNWRMHRVAPGETIAEIARRYATAAGAIAEVNHSLADVPEAGDLLIIPASYPPARATANHTASKAASHRRGTKLTASASKPVPERVLHHRAARTYKAAAVPTHRTHTAN